MGGLEGGQEGRDLRGIVLAVGVEGDDRRRAVFEGVPEPGPEGGALAGVRSLDEDDGAGRLGLGRGVVGRAVVDDDDRQVAARGLDDRRDPRVLPGSPGSARRSWVLRPWHRSRGGAPARIRTWDLPLRRRLLCPLSYGDVAGV